jgi:hypothetical protein
MIIDVALIKLILKAHAARSAIEVEPRSPNMRGGRAMRGSIFGVRLRLSYLAPDITAAILEGSEPAALNRQSFARLKGLPHKWSAQWRVIARSKAR